MPSSKTLLKTQFQNNAFENNEKVFSVSEFLEFLNIHLNALKVSVVGEISSIDIRGNSVFLTIADKIDKSLLSCWAPKNILDSKGIVLNIGLEIKVTGVPYFYKANGKFNLKLSSVSLIGEGELKIAFERLKERLGGMGYFDEKRKRTIPKYSQRIGLITSTSARAKTDFLTHLCSKNLKVYFMDVRVEGSNSENDVAQAIQQMNQMDLDVIVLTRGGGSYESLQSFNSEVVAKAIYSSRIPIVCAVGHEDDKTIAEFVADLRESTPTAAGEGLSRYWLQAESQVENYKSSILSNYSKAISINRQRYDNYIKNILSDLHKKIINNKKDLFEKRKYIIQNCNSIILKLKNIQKDFIQSVDIYEKFLKSSRKISFEREKYLFFSFKKVSIGLNNLDKQFSQNYNIFEKEISKQRLQFNSLQKNVFYNGSKWNKSVLITVENHEKQLDLNDPKRRLKQGYSIITDKNGKIVKSINQVEAGDETEIMLMDGNLNTKILNKKRI